MNEAERKAFETVAYQRYLHDMMLYHPFQMPQPPRVFFLRHGDTYAEATLNAAWWAWCERGRTCADQPSA